MATPLGRRLYIKRCLLGGLTSWRYRHPDRQRPLPASLAGAIRPMTGAIGMDRYAVLGILLEGVVQTVVEQIPAERQAKAAATLFELLIERSAASGNPGQDQKKPA